MPPETDRGLLYLERKLAVLNRARAETSGSSALDILTGSDRSTIVPLRPRGGATYWTARALCGDEESVEPSEWSVAQGPLGLGAGDNNISTLPLRIERPQPPSTSGRAARLLAVAVVSAVVFSAAGYAFRSVTERVDVAPSTVSQGDAAMDTAMPAVSPESVDVPDSAVESATLSPPPSLPDSASTPLPSSVMRTLVDERFVTNVGDWPNDPNGTTWLSAGTYWLAARHATQFVAVGVPGAQDLGDTVVSAWFRKTGGPDGGGYGLILRAQDPGALDGKAQLGHYYVFEAGDRGDIGIWLRDGDHWIDLLPWTPSDAINLGSASNELTVTAVGDQLSFLINGTPVATQTDTVLHTGAAGVFVGGDGNEVALDRIVVRVPR